MAFLTAQKIRKVLDGAGRLSAIIIVWKPPGYPHP